ncbi:MAG: DNA cytosine methyltransferase [Muribaculaceae bacterium]|nr:DNA cytosine methyltransferase [Muribaculaceae bacterium]
MSVYWDLLTIVFGVMVVYFRTFVVKTFFQNHSSDIVYFMPSDRRTYISLFSSAGVGCYGFKQCGFECIATNELLPDRLLVQRANAKCKYDSGYILGDITLESTKTRLFEEIEMWRKVEKLSTVDVVFATPPCQGMSTANYKKNSEEKIRNSLVVEAIKIIDRIKPKVFVFENVRAFMKTICTDISGEEMPIRDSIFKNLGQDYHIYYKVINFKDYGVPSSRPRTLVVGTLKSLLNISPLNLFPVRSKEKVLRDAIGDLPPLGFSERDAADPFHFARPFPEYMLPWISELGEGESAFSNPEERKPYRINKEGRRVMLKGAYMGNKYRRLFWDRPCACIATRNDQLASQDTIHPTDNRVLSIRELMRVMAIPVSFRWTSVDDALTVDSAPAYLKKNELNIRRCIGEAVPTHIVWQIARNIAEMLDFEDFVNSYHNGESPVGDHTNFYIESFVAENAIADAHASGSFYTPQSVVFNAIKNVVSDKDIVSILEPAAGLGAFLPQICSLFSEASCINIDAVEISPEIVEKLQEIIKLVDLGDNVTINHIQSDFLEFDPRRRYDFVFTNPPYVKATEKHPEICGTMHRTGNMFALFMIKLHGMASDMICVIPKNFLMADEFESVRNLYRDCPIVSVCDFGVRFFKKVFIEIVSLHFSERYTGHVCVEDFVNNRFYVHPQGYIYHDHVWLIYRNAFFDAFVKKMSLDVFKAFRDRQITKSMVSTEGRYRVLKSKNIQDDGSIVDKPGYDRFIDDISNLSVGKFLNTSCMLMPNFTYNLRASYLPADTIPNGSIAILQPKRHLGCIDMGFYSTAEFREYYAIVKSYSRFTLNIDNSALYYIGVPHEKQ